MDREFVRELGDGLALRPATPDDTDRLAAFHGEMHQDVADGELHENVAAVVRDLMHGDHPTCQAGDFTLVEEPASGSVVSSLCLISQTWSYGGVEMGAGRPELVATHPGYRNRGLVRAQFDLIHQWSAERGHRLQAVTGIPYFYRQFGYEMAMTLGGARVGYKPNLPELKDGEEEGYRLRPAEESDLGFMSQTHAKGNGRYLATCLRDEALWRYELLGRSKASVNRWAFRMIETANREPVGFLAHSPRLTRGVMAVGIYELKPGISWSAVSPAVMRLLWALGDEWAAAQPGQEMERLAFWLGVEHPAYQVLAGRLPHISKPYAWYLRVPDLPGFLKRVAPVLEHRLARSVLVGHSGELKISFYRSGIRLHFEEGRLADVAAWRPASDDARDAVFPDLVFLQLLFGYRALDELKYAFPDCGTSSDEAQALLNVLFPKQESQVWPVG
jgi:hypothetical protein